MNNCNIKTHSKTWQQVLAIMVFVLCGILIFSRISEIFRKKTGGATDMVHSFYSLGENEIDVLFLGSSHGYASVQPNELWNEYGIPSYSMCSHGQSVATSYYLLKEALIYQSPKVVFLETYTFCDNKKHRGEGMMRMAFDGMRMGTVKKEMIDDFLADASFSEKVTYYLPFIKYHSRWSELKNSDFHNALYLKGTLLSTAIHPNEDPGIPDNYSELGGVSCDYFKKIVELCEENNVQLVLYAAPFSIKSNYKNYCYRQGINNTLEKWLAENWGNEIPFLYYQKSGEAAIDFATDFRDTHHMNAYGAKKITHCIGEFLQQYNLTDHRGDRAYASWNEDYETYLKTFQSRENSSEDTTADDN